MKVNLPRRVRKGIKIEPAGYGPLAGCPAGLGKRFG